MDLPLKIPGAEVRLFIEEEDWHRKPGNFFFSGLALIVLNFELIFSQSSYIVDDSIEKEGISSISKKLMLNFLKGVLMTPRKTFFVTKSTLTTGQAISRLLHNEYGFTGLGRFVWISVGSLKIFHSMGYRPIHLLRQWIRPLKRRMRDLNPR